MKLYTNITENCKNTIERSSRTFAASFSVGETKYTDIKSLKILVPSAFNGKVGIGGTISNSVEIISGKIKLTSGTVIKAYESVLLDSGEYEDVPMGKYRITSAVTKDSLTTIKAEGPLSTETGLGYFSNLEYPATTIQMLNEISDAINVPIIVDGLEEIYIDSKPEGYTYREVIGYLAAVHGTNAAETRDGSIALKWYEHCEEDIFTDRADSPDINNELFVVGKLECTTSSECIVRGDGKTGIAINNPLVTENIADIIWNKIGGFTYRAATFNVKLGNPCVDIWDCFSYKDDTVIATELQYVHDGGLQNVYKSVGESETSANGAKGPVTKQMERYWQELVFINEALVNKLSVDQLDAVEANITSAVIGTIDGRYATFEYLSSNYINTTVFEAISGRVGTLEANQLTVSALDARYATIEHFNAATARISTLEANQLTVSGLKADFADIALSNVAVENVGKLFADVGLITSATIQNGHITGYLDSVEVNANSVTAGTLSVDRLVFRGSDKSIVYELNNITGALQAVQGDTLNGEILTDRSITVDKIVAKSITANEIAAGTIAATELNVSNIFSNSAVINTLTAQEAFINAISTNSIVVGASNDAASALATANAANSNAANALAGANSSVKSITIHYLATSASSGVTTSTSGWTTTPQKITSTKKYLWTYQTITAVSGSRMNTTPVISGVYGDKGATGSTGATGNGISKVVPLYYLKSNTTAPSAPTSAVTSTSTSSGVWTTAIPTYVRGYTYFTCMQTLYTSGKYGWSAVVADNALTNANSTANSANTNASNALSTANSANSIIASWCYNNNTTYINGGKIYAGTITASQIAAGTITADKINITDLFSKNITATGTISGATLEGGRISSEAGPLGEWVNICNGHVFTYNSDGDSLMDFGGNEILFYSTKYPERIVGCISSVYNEDAVMDTMTITADDLRIDLSYEAFYVYGGSKLLFAVSPEQNESWFNTDVYIYGADLNVSKSVYANKLVSRGNNTVDYCLHAGGKTLLEDETISISANAFRCAYGSYGAILRADGANFYILLTNQGEAETGAWNSFRPLTINLASGTVQFGHDVAFSSNARIANSRSFSAYGTNGTAYSLAKMTSDNIIQYGNGSPRTQIMSTSRIDFLTGGVTSTSSRGISITYDNGYPYLRPTLNGQAYLGSSSLRWAGIFSTTSVSVSSDRRLKSDINNLDDRYLALAKVLSAKSYFLNMLNDDKRHVGYIAQDVEQAMLSVGLTAQDCGFVSKDWVEREDYTGYEYSLNYDEIHTMCIASLQKEVEELKTELLIAKAKIEYLQLQQPGA